MRTSRLAVYGLLVFLVSIATLMPAKADYIHTASRRGSKAEIQRILQEKPKLVNAKNKDGDGAQPIHYAAWQADKETIKLLIDNKADVKATDKNGWTLLHYAALSGKQENVEYVLSLGADPKAYVKGDGLTPLHLAAGKSNSQIVELLIARGAGVNAKDKKDETPLHRAARSAGNAEIVRILLAKGADVNAKNKQGCTPLHIAYESRHSDSGVFALLFNAKGTVLTGQSLVDAILSKQIDQANGLIKSDPKAISDIVSTKVYYFSGFTPLHAAAESGNVPLVKQLLDAGASIDAIDSDGATPLFYAAMEGWVDVVRVLLDRQANPQLAKKNGMTPLHIWAANAFSEEIGELLLAKGVGVNVKTKNSDTPLLLAAQFDKPSAISVLLKHGADVSAKDKYGWMPLHNAVTFTDNVKVVEMLIDHGADIEKTVGDGYTPLILAAKYDHKLVADYLIGKKANINAHESFFHLTPLHFAVGTTDIDLAKLLIQRGADINARATKKRVTIAMIKMGSLTPLNLALTYGDIEMADLLKANGGKKDSEIKKD